MSAEKSGTRDLVLLRAAMWLALLFFPQWVFAVNYFSRLAGPVTWSAAGSWSTVACGGASAGGAEPGGGAGDTATICNGHTMVLNLTPANALTTLTVNAGGTLDIGNNNTARTLTVTGLISNSGTLQVPTTSNTTHAIVAGGDITNAGTFNLATDAGSLCNVTFNRNGNQTVSGAGATTRFNRMTLNMGATNANVLEITATNFSINPAAPTNFLTLTNGTFKFSTTGAITPFTAAPAISATRGFWLNNAGATVSSGNFDWTVTGTSNAARGLVRVTAGTLNLGTNANNDLVTGNFSDIVVEGGTINIAGALLRAAVANDVRFNMSGGTLTVGTVGVSTAGIAPFMIENAATFTMSNGTIVIRRPGAGNLGYQNLDAGATVTGGTVQIGDASTPAASTMQINSVASVGNLTVNSANATAQMQTNPLIVLGNVTITAGTLNANNLDTTLGGNWVNDDSFTQGTGTVTFNGVAAQTIGGTTSTTFNNLTIANTVGGVSLTTSQTVGAAGAGTLTLTSGTFAVGANTLTLDGPTIAGTPANLSTTSSSNLTFGGNAAGINLPSSVTDLNNLVLNNTNATPQLTLNSSPTIAGILTLTSGVIVTGTNTLTTSADCPGSVVRTGGWVSGSLRLRFPSAVTCTFHVGESTTTYTPLQLAFSAVTTAGSLTGSATTTPVTLDHPNTTAGSSGVLFDRSVNRYWTLSDSSMAGTATATFTYVAGDNDGGTTPASYLIRRGSGCAGTGSTRTCAPWLALTVSGTPTTTGAVASGVSIAVGAAAQADLAIGQVDPTTNFLRERQFIYTRELY